MLAEVAHSANGLAVNPHRYGVHGTETLGERRCLESGPFPVQGADVLHGDGRPGLVALHARPGACPELEDLNELASFARKGQDLQFAVRIGQEAFSRFPSGWK